MIPTTCISAVSFIRFDHETAEFLAEIIPPMAGLRQVVG